MSRAIKFRAWHDDGFWLYADLSDLVTNQLERQGYSPIQVTKWCQYTGLKDKNGVEVYEGDIVNFSENFGYAGWHESNNPGVVEFNRGQFHVVGSQMSLAGDVTNHGVEVIGNIYENKELLK